MNQFFVSAEIRNIFYFLEELASKDKNDEEADAEDVDADEEDKVEKDEL